MTTTPFLGPLGSSRTTAVGSADTGTDPVGSSGGAAGDPSGEQFLDQLLAALTGGAVPPTVLPAPAYQADTSNAGAGTSTATTVTAAPAAVDQLAAAQAGPTGPAPGAQPAAQPLAAADVPNTPAGTMPTTTPSTASAAPVTPSTPTKATTPGSATPGPAAKPAGTATTSPAPRTSTDAEAAPQSSPATTAPTTPTATPTTPAPAPADQQTPPTAVQGVQAPTPAPSATQATAQPSGQTAAPAPSTAVLRQVFPEITRLAASGSGTHRLALTLHPESLGEVRIVLTVRDDAVRVTLAADRAHDQLVQDAPELRRLLEMTGSSDTRIVVRDLGATSAAPATDTGSSTTGTSTTTTGGFDRSGGRQAAHDDRDPPASTAPASRPTDPAPAVRPRTSAGLDRLI